MAQGGYEILKQRMAQSRQQRNGNELKPFEFKMKKDLVSPDVKPEDMVDKQKLPNFAVIRLVDDIDTFEWAWAHPITRSGVGKSGKPWSRTEQENCLDQDQEDPLNSCPACKAGIERKQRFWVNLIWRNAPILELNQYGEPYPYKIIGVEDQLAVWNSGQSLFKILDELQQEYGDITAQDFKLKRDVQNDYNPYSLSARQPQPTELSPNDKQLVAKRYDLRQLSKPKSYNDLADMLGAPPRREDAEEDSARSFTGSSPYEAPGTQIKSKLAGRYEK
jgi:hypothetical protein